MWTFFFIWQNRSSNQRSCMILEVQFQNFDARAECTSPHTSKFSFSKNSREPNINIFCENWCKAFFYIKEQTQKYNFEIWLFKSTILDPQKVRFWFLKKTPTKIFSSGFGFDSALKTIDAQMVLWLVFLLLKMHTKNYWLSKKQGWAPHSFAFCTHHSFAFF